MREKSKVSVIITTKNEERNLANCLGSIKSQSYKEPNIEIIVVDNNSTDRTKEIAYQYTDKVYNFGPERSAQRNFGSRQASGEYILYLDADMILSRNVLSECVDRCNLEVLSALYIPEKIVGRGFWIKARNFERSFYYRTVIDCVRFIRREKLLEIGGFDETLTGPEDWDFDRRIREIGKVGAVNAHIYHNEETFHLSRYIRKKLYYVASFDKYIQKWGRADPIIKKQFGFLNRYFVVFTENRKWKEIVNHPVLTAGMYYLKFMLGVGYLYELYKKR